MTKALLSLALVVVMAAALVPDATEPVGTAIPAKPTRPGPTDDSMWVKLDSIPSQTRYQCIYVRNDTVFCALQDSAVHYRNRLTGALIGSFPTRGGDPVIAICAFADSICVSRLASPEICEVYTLGGTFVRQFAPTGGRQVRGLDWDGSKFWATTFSSPNNLTIYTMDRNGNVLRSLTQSGGVVLPTNSRDLVLDRMYPNRLWSMPHASGGSYLVMYCRFDTVANTWTPTDTFRTGLPTYMSGIGFHYDPAVGGCVYASCFYGNWIWRFKVHEPLTGLLNPDSLYFKNFNVTNVLYGCPKSQVPNPAPGNCRPPFTFLSGQSRVGADPAGRYIYEVSTGTTLRRHRTADGSYTDFTLANPGNTAVRTDGQFLYVPFGNRVYKYDLTGNFINMTTINISPDYYNFSLARDTIWCGTSSLLYGYACSRFTGGTITHDATWDIGGGTGDPAFVAWDGTQYYVAHSGYPTNAFKVFSPARTLIASGTIALDPRGLMCVVPSSRLRLLVLYSDDGPPDSLGAALTALGDSVEYRSVQSATPTLAELLPYDGVIAFSNYAFADPTALGNVLADYVDAGNGVVLTNFSFATGWQLAGRIMTGAYGTFVPGGLSFNNRLLGWYNSSHPVMAGVSTVGDYYICDIALASGADSVAKWNDGEYYVAASANRRVVGINSYPGINGNSRRSGSWARVIHNAAVWTAGGGTGVVADPMPEPALRVALVVGPNPARRRATVTFSVPTKSTVRLSLYDQTGRLVQPGPAIAGTTGTWNLDLAGLAPGVYFCRLTAGSYTVNRKLVVQR